MQEKSKKMRIIEALTSNDGWNLMLSSGAWL